MVGQNIRLRIRARDVAIATARPKHVSIRNIIQAKITEIASDKHAAYAVVTLNFNDAELRACITRASCSELNLTIGMTVFALIKSVSFEGRL